MKDLIVTCKIYGDSADKLPALIQFAGAGFLPGDIEKCCLEVGIFEMWEEYRKNPKHAAQIKLWEKERRVKEQASQKEEPCPEYEPLKKELL